MAKKKTNKQAEEAIVRNAPAEAKWLNQPINITFMRGDLNLNHVNTMIALIDTLQTKINTALTEKQRSVFTDEDFDAQGKVVIPVPFNVITDDPRRYAYFEAVAKSLAETSVTTERIDKDGKPYTSIKPIINEARIPRSDGGHRGVIEFVIERDMIDTLFDLNRYNRYIKSIARSAKSVYTSRIYQFITAYKNIGVWRPLYKDLHIMFGLSHWKTDPKTREKEWIADKYPNYRQFKQKILKVAHDELQELAESKQVDCYFDFKEIYPAGRSNGMPERIEFVIHTTDYGQQAEDVQAFARHRADIEKTLRETYFLKSADCRQILSLVTQDNVQLCIAKMREIGEWIEKNGSQIEDRKKYMIASLRNALMETIPVAAEDVHDTGEKESVEEGRAVDPRARELFDAWIAGVPAEWREAFSPDGTEGDRLVVRMPSKSTMDAFINTFGADALGNIIVMYGG